MGRKLTLILQKLFIPMRKRYYLWQITGFILILLFAIIFKKIVLYIAIASVIFLICYPVNRKITLLKFGNKTIPKWLSALITLMLLCVVLFTLFMVIVPPLIVQANTLSSLSLKDVSHNLIMQFPSLGTFLGSLGNEADMKEVIGQQVESFLNISNFSKILGNMLNYAGSIAGGIYCVLFISFFFLKDENLVRSGILLLSPSRYEKDIKEILHTTKEMLGKYFSGLFLDMLLVGLAVGFLMWFLGIKNALLIGFLAGLFNAVPYIGPIITMLVAVFLGVSDCLTEAAYDQISITITKIAIGLVCINLADGMLLQPVIYSNSVRAHPLEIFLVILMGSTLAGIGGMIVAIPTYTIFRIVARQFFSRFKFIDKITEGIDDESP